MNNIAKDMLVGVCCGAGLVLTLWLAYPAHADGNSFINDAHAHGYGNTYGDGAILNTGNSVCTYMHNLNADQEAEILYKISGLPSLDSARVFVMLAVDDLCPEYDHTGTTA